MVKSPKHTKTASSANQPPGFIDPDALYTAEELMNRLRMGRRTFRQLRHKGIEVVRCGRRDYVVGRSAIEAFLRIAEESAKERTTAIHIPKPAIVTAAGQPPKVIEEFVGRVSSGTKAVSIARMKSPSGWSEVGQTPKFDEYTVVLQGSLHVKMRESAFDVSAGQAIIVKAGEWVQYSSPSHDGAEYIAVCIPAFSPENANRDEG